MVITLDFNKIENKHRKVINKAKSYINEIMDYKHDINHINDVVYFTKKILEKTNANPEVCIICAYWHDVGRIKKEEGHEKLSALMLKEELIKENYDEDFIRECYDAIINHKYNMTPTTLNGIVIKDADKLAYLGKGRWRQCLVNKVDLTDIIDLLPRLRNNILTLDISKEIYDKEIIEILILLYKELKK